MALKLYNSLTRKKELFRPIKKRLVGLYTCGPTVYQYAHVGNLRTYLFADILKRALLINRYRVKHVMNITDVGHLTSDADTGKDKVAQEAKRQRKSAWDIARFYEHAFKKDLERLNIIPPSVWARATDHIQEQIKLIRQLERKGFTYRTSDGIYFDTTRFAHYASFGRNNLKGIRAGSRVARGEKLHATDFALWKFSPKKARRDMEWSSPWGMGFPGWHIECSSMSMKYLGKHFDIHTGGIDHIAIHHTNEIAQSEAATGITFVNVWVHGNFLRLGKARMGKSEKNFITLETLIEHGFDALDFRYLALTAHYRSPMAFTFQALKAARTARLRLLEHIRSAIKTKRRPRVTRPLSPSLYAKSAFLREINNDLNVPRALAVARKHIEKTAHTSRNTAASIAWFDQILGLRLLESAYLTPSLPAAIQKLMQEREALRKSKEWESADKIREVIKKQGWELEDTASGTKLKKR
ncbi:MAG: cysteine--tRNA ligase [Parcubacteria group bacterium]|nr:cysteine--tRNA ligase [Parcubacteria group bacterium]